MAKEKATEVQEVDITEEPAEEVSPVIEGYETLNVNYPAMEYLGWLEADYQKAIQYSKELFAGGLANKTDSTDALIVALKKSLVEIEDDLTKIKGFLAEYSS